MNRFYYAPFVVRVLISIILIIFITPMTLAILFAHITLIQRLMLFIMSLLFTINMLNIVLKRIYANKTGIGYKDFINTYFIEWAKITKVGIVIHQPRPISVNHVICFTTKDELESFFSHKKQSNELIYCTASKNLISLIQEHYKGEIDNLNIFNTNF